MKFLTRLAAAGLALLLTSALAQSAQAPSTCRLVEETLVAPNGLFFTKAAFSNRISPHGDCIDALNGFVYVTWYRGGMDDRHVMLSRMKIGTGVWKTIEFPHRHVMFRHDPTKGDAHNVISVAVSPIDNTVHLLYDMHAYTRKEKPTDYFNYQVSQPGMATVADDQWNLAAFHPKRDYLRKGEDYERFTYPNFSRTDTGMLVVEGRYGGSGSGNKILATYNGTGWSRTTTFHVGIAPGKDAVSIYGGMQFLQGKLRMGFAIRKNQRAADLINEGMYYAETDDPRGTGPWFTANRTRLKLPLASLTPLKIAEPIAAGLGRRITSSPEWTVTANGSLHFVTSVQGKGVHYYKAPGATAFSQALHTPSGDLHALGDKVYMVSLENGKPVIRSTPAGENQWTIEYQASGGRAYTHGRSVLDQRQLFFYVMADGSGDSRPLHLLQFEL